MDSGLVLLTLALGLVVGASFTGLIYAAAKRGKHAAKVARTAVPDGVDDVIAAIGFAVLVVDASNNVVKASDAATSLGLNQDGSLRHKTLSDLVTTVRNSREPHTVHLDIARGPLGDATTHLHVRASPMGTRHVLVVAEDRTESLRLEGTQRDFIANISHELKTPIGAVSLLAEALQEASSEPEQVERFAARLTAEAQRLNRLTQEIIALSRLQGQDPLTHARDIDLDTIVNAAIDQTRVMADAHNISLVTGGDTGITVRGDDSLLIMAVHNLLSNAVLYSPDGSRVGVGVRKTDGIIEIAVTDQGIGISEGDLSRIFDRFFRVDPARSRNTGGTGLGLSIVKHTVHNHGGDVKVWSQPGQGSTFTIRLPEAPTHSRSPGETP